MKTVMINIENLKCHGCARTITTGLEKINGVESVDVNIPGSSVIVALNDENVLIQVKEKLKSLGYPEAGQQNNIGLKAKSFVSCAVGRINK